MPRLWTVDAFAEGTLKGNQAGVCILDGPAPEKWMQALATKLGFAETAFLSPQAGSRRLRWFTPAKEVKLCGHATLAAAHVLWSEGLLAATEPAVFQTLSGELRCRRDRHGITMDFPADFAYARPAPAGLFAALGCVPGDAYEANGYGNLMVVLPTESDVHDTAPDFAALRRFSSKWAYIVTAPASRRGYDFVVRYFAPAWGIDEDPATGSIQCTLGPYWSARMAKPALRCLQMSQRGAALRVTPRGRRVDITGKALIRRKATVPAPR